jgi:oligosaccharide repeat unit polymerase
LEPKYAYGANTFRFFYALLFKIGISDVKPQELIREYMYIPDPINVYTVYENYYLDYSYYGMIIPGIFLIVHYLLYAKARRKSGVWTFYYASSTYPLIMQFFQDQYFSLLSIWLQVIFWYYLFISLPEKKSYLTRLFHHEIF